jgi:hypothetical protein
VPSEIAASPKRDKCCSKWNSLNVKEANGSFWMYFYFIIK